MSSASNLMEDVASKVESDQKKSAYETGIWHIETLKSAQDIRANAQAWLELERDCIDPQAAFQAYDWCESWATSFCKNSDSPVQPSILMIYRGGNLVAILPMMTTSHLGVRVLTLFGEPHSQIANAIIRGGVDCTDGLKLCIAQASLLSNADVMALGPLVEDGPLAQALEQDCLSPDPAESLTMTTWPGIWRSEDYLKTSKVISKNSFKRRMRRLEKFGAVDFQRHDARSPKFKPLVREALELKREWLSRNGMWSLGLSREGVDEFLIGITAHDGGFEVEVDELTVDGKPAALGINLVGCQLRSNYLTVYDHEYHQASPGTLLYMYSILGSIDDGMNAFSFLGFPTASKAKWTNTAMPLVRYQKALNLKGQIWLNGWSRGARPLAKWGLGKVRTVLDHPRAKQLLKSVRS